MTDNKKETQHRKLEASFHQPVKHRRGVGGRRQRQLPLAANNLRRRGSDITQLPKTKFVRDCNVKPADPTGHENMKFAFATEMIKGGGAWGMALASKLAALSPAMFKADTT